MAGSGHIGKIILLMFGGGFLSVVVLVGWFLLKADPPVQRIDIDGYKPSPEFASTYAVLKKAAKASESKNVGAPTHADMRPSDFNLERTFRVIRSLDIAEKGCADWMSFLKYLKRLDYRGVPAEVVDAQSKLLPILDRIREIEADFDENSGGMVVLKAVKAGADVAIGDVDEGALKNILSASAPPAGALRAINIAQKSLGPALENYKATGLKRRQIEGRLKEVQFAYLKFLANYVPIRIKYEKEWDELCLVKDKMHIQIGAANWESAAKTARAIMVKYPYDRESAVLCALALSRMALADARAKSDKDYLAPLLKGNNFMKDIAEIVKVPATLVPEHDPRIVEAGQILVKYVNEHPNSTAPALIVGGLIKSMVGDMRSAMEFLDQASEKYKSDAVKLGDMLESYASRPYLAKTAEGQRLLLLHRSFCEGFGAFSPNLEKAFVYERAGEFKKAQEVVFNHFFGRASQDSVHTLVADMDFCEQNLSKGFKGLLMEHSYLDVEFEQVRNAKTLGITTKDGVIQVSLRNRADIELSNVRLFLCVQFTEMYKGEYDILKVGSSGVLHAGERCEFPVTDLGRDDKKFKDIANVRAIVMTDDKICWVDTVRAKRAHAINVASGADRLELPFAVSEYLSAFGLSVAKIAGLARESPVLFESRMWPMSDVLEISLPRIFAALDPVFTIGEIGTDGCIYPEEDRVGGTKITLRFPVKLKDSESCDLCVNSDYCSFRITLKREGKNVSISGVSHLEPLKK